MTSTETTTLVTSTEEALTEENSDLLIVEIAVPTVVVLLIIIIIIIVIVRLKRKKAHDTIYNVKDTERTHDPKLDENRISTISSTPINPYELMSLYARMPQSTTSNVKIDNCKNAGNPSSPNVNGIDDDYETPTVDETSGKNDVVISYSSLSGSDQTPPVYGIVNKRQSRQRAVVGHDVRDSSENGNEAVNGSEGSPNNADAQSNDFKCPNGKDNNSVMPEANENECDDVKMEDVALY